MAFFQGGFADTTTFGVVYSVTAGVINCTGCIGTMAYSNYPTYALPPPRMPPKNWRWFDSFRLLLAPLIPTGAAMAFALVRVPTAASLAQAARWKRRRALQRMR